MTGSTIIRVAFEGGVTAAAIQSREGWWVIALSDGIEPGSAEEHLALAAAERSIGGWMMDFRQPEGGVDCQAIHLPGVTGAQVTRLPAARRPHEPHWMTTGVAAAAIAPLTALAWAVQHFLSVVLAPGIIS